MLRLGDRLIDWRGPVVMAIVNITPDSFFAESRGRIDPEQLEHASVVDLGGYSTRPGAEEVSLDEELNRLRQGLAAVSPLLTPDQVLSIDTFRAEVVEQIYREAGPFIVNDVSGGADPAMFETVGRLGLPYILTHSRGTPQTMGSLTDYDNVVAEVIRFFAERIAAARAAGVVDLLLDPGFGFAKTTEQNFELLRRLDELSLFGLPVVVGVSRKGMVWKTLETTPDRALGGTTALHFAALERGASLLRVHDPREADQTIRLFITFAFGEGGGASAISRQA